MGDMRHVCCDKCRKEGKWTVITTFGRNSPDDDYLAYLFASTGCEKHRKEEESLDTARSTDMEAGY